MAGPNCVGGNGARSSCLTPKAVARGPRATPSPGMARQFSVVQLQSHRARTFVFAPAFAAFSATRNFTMRVTSSSGSGSSIGNCTAPFDVA